jgi:hypothetical protein
VCEDILDENPLGLVINSYNQPEVVASNIEHREHLFFHWNVVGGWVGLTDIRKAFPFSGFGGSIPGIKGCTDPAVQLSSSSNFLRLKTCSLRPFRRALIRMQAASSIQSYFAKCEVSKNAGVRRTKRGKTSY